MDKSVDSIGSCSLDVDAVSTDFSDTSSSLNLLTPSSAKDFTREFTSGIHERCKVPITIINNNKSIATVKTTTTISQLDPASGKINTIVYPSINLDSDAAKKPSYINLACCVNGYSNLTTYDSKLRQDINRSREVSPIRPITQYFYNRSENHSTHLPAIYLNVPTPNCFTLSGITMDMQNDMQTIKDTRNGHKNQSTFRNRNTESADNNCMTKNGKESITAIYNNVLSNDKNNDVNKRKSFIQQRVERLYGKDSALAQGFLNKRKSSENSFNGDDKTYLQKSIDDSITYNSELAKATLTSLTNNKDVVFDENDNHDEIDNASLPVLRHLKLNSEFRKQLQLISPKKNVTKTNENGTMQKITTVNLVLTPKLDNTKEFKPKPAIEKEQIKSKLNTKNNDNITTVEASIDEQTKMGELADNIKQTLEIEKNGHYFLKIMNQEKDRLLAMAVKVEIDLEILLSNETEDFEEVIGYLRAATGKAKLLCAKKMKQFEGLCNNNICRSPDEPFETTSEDLQGFWDMVMIQVDHVDSLFQEIKDIKANGWKKPKAPSPIPPQGAKMLRKPIHSKTTTANSSQTSQKKSSTSILLAQKREAQRKHFAELKRKNKISNNNVPDEAADVEFFVANKS